MSPLYDAHNHLQDEWLAPFRSEMFADLKRAGIARGVTNGTSELDWQDVDELARQHAFVLPSYGLHPWHVGNRTPQWQEKLLRHLDAHPGAGVGEIGLDRWMLDRAKPDDRRLAGLRRAPIEEQIEAFTWQLGIAAERNAPASIHCVDAYGLIIDVLESSPRPSRGFLMHFYGGSAELVPRLVRLGSYFSFNAGFLDPRRRRLRETYSAIPFDRILIESDAPAIPLPRDREEFPAYPTPDRRRAIHPANLRAGYSGLAEWWDIRVEKLADLAAQNFAALFGTR